MYRPWDQHRGYSEELLPPARVPVESVGPGPTSATRSKSKIGDPKKLEALGWKIQYALDDTLRQILDYWRSIPD